MRKILFPFLLAFIFLCQINCTRHPVTNNLILKYKINFLSAYSHDYSFGQLNNKRQISYKIVYDDSGRIISNTEFKSDSATDSSLDRIDSKILYSYNNLGLRSEILKYLNTGALLYREVITYVDSNKIASEVYYNKNGDTAAYVVCFYDSLGRLKEKKLNGVFWEDGSIMDQLLDIDPLDHTSYISKLTSPFPGEVIYERFPNGKIKEREFYNSVESKAKEYFYTKDWKLSKIISIGRTPNSKIDTSEIDLFDPLHRKKTEIKIHYKMFRPDEKDTTITVTESDSLNRVKDLIVFSGYPVSYYNKFNASLVESRTLYNYDARGFLKNTIKYDRNNEAYNEIEFVYVQFR